MPNLPLRNVTSHSNFTTRVQSVSGSGDRFHDIYAGDVTVQFQNTGGTTSRETFSVLLPISDNTIRRYTLGGEETFEVTTLVSLGGIIAKEDEEFIGSVDGFRTELRDHQFPGISGTVNCLVLSFDLALLNGVILHVGYNVNVLVDGRISPIGDLPDDTEPQ